MEQMRKFAFARKSKDGRRRLTWELIGARVADADSTIARSGCSRYKYLSRARAREGAGASASRREGWSTFAEGSRNNGVHACARVCVNTQEIGELEFSSRGKPSLGTWKTKTSWPTTARMSSPFRRVLWESLSDFSSPFSRIFAETFIGREMGVFL